VLLEVALVARRADPSHDLAADRPAEVVELRLELVEGFLGQPDGGTFAAGLGHGGAPVLCRWDRVTHGCAPVVSGKWMSLPMRQAPPQNHPEAGDNGE